LTPRAAYVHITSNNTDYGTQWASWPDVGDTPLVSDSTSGHLQSSARCVAVRPHLRGCAEESRTLGIDGRDPARGSAGAAVRRAAFDAELPRPCRTQIDLQHAADFLGVRPAVDG